MNEIQSLLSDIPQFIRGVKTYTQITMINFNDKENAVGTQKRVTYTVLGDKNALLWNCLLRHGIKDIGVLW